jgi:peroxiredoxin
VPKTQSYPIATGVKAADFLLPDARGQVHQLADYSDKPALLVAFISNRCPFVVLLREAFAQFGREYEVGAADHRDQQQ